MNNIGKNINLFLMDGDVKGRIKCSLANWTGVAYKIPRTMLDECKNRDDLKQSGVYFLFGIEEETGNNLVYIGQAGVRKNGEGILFRLLEHRRNSDKDYWTEAVVFTTSNNSFGPTEISYLENRFCKLANQANRYIVKNANDPSQGNITEEKECEMEEFIEYAKITMGALGLKVFNPYTEYHKSTDSELGAVENTTDERTLYLTHTTKESGKIEATARQTSEGFVILKESMIQTKDFDSLPQKIKDQRSKANIVNNILQEDKLFNSPSSAAAFVIGTSANGKEKWKDVNGKTLNQLENDL